MGRLAVGGDTAFLVFLGAFIGLVASGQTGGDTFFSNPWLSASILLAGGAAVASGIVGLVCILTRQERSLPVFATVALGAVVLAWAIAEIAISH
jgi:hypothetical protein